MSGRLGRVEKQATMDEAYLKDHGAAQEFGFLRKAMKKLFVRSNEQFRQLLQIALWLNCTAASLLLFES
jgi:hypothetical protein